jgi:two-component system OmpR family response regulator
MVGRGRGANGDGDERLLRGVFGSFSLRVVVLFYLVDAMTRPEPETAERQPRGKSTVQEGRADQERDVKYSASTLLVEDDAEIGDLISRYLKANQFDVVVVKDGAAMDVALAERDFDLLILDLNLPGEDGLSICRRLRAERDLPIIIVTAQGEDVDKIVGLEMGADDYIAKPFNPRELLARIRSVLRRASAADPIEAGSARQVYKFSGWSVDLAAREVVAPVGMKVAMTGAEFDLLHALCEHPNRVLTRDQLISLTHGPTAGPFERSIDTLISRLRQKIETDVKNPKLIQTVRSEGYMFTTPVTRS